jgi:hypothetical protein
MMPPPAGLASIFLARIPASSRVARPPDLDGELNAKVGAGRAAWPTVNLDPRAFVHALAERSASHCSICSRYAP